MSAVDQHAPSGEIGRPRTRVEDPRLVAGHGRYVEDIQLPGMLHMVLVRSPYPHARILRVNAEAARAASGVRLVLVGVDVPPIARLPVAAVAPELKVPPYEPLCATVARAVGMPVAAVIAEERSAAFDAAALVDVEYESLDGVADPEAALADVPPLLYPEFGTNACYTLPLSRGHVDAAFGARARRRGRTVYGKYTDTAPFAGHQPGTALRPTGRRHNRRHARGKNPGDVWSIPTRPLRAAHFAAFPVDLPARCIAAGCPPGGVVLDPFSGAGTTGLAALERGARFTGIDLNPAFHRLALDRLGRPNPGTGTGRGTGDGGQPNGERRGRAA